MPPRFLPLLLAPTLLANAEIPPPVRAMLDAAIASGNERDVAVIERYAKSAAPDSATEIAAIADRWREDRSAARESRILEAGLLDLWKGRGEVGGFRTTGNTDNLGVSGTLDTTREGLEWRHRLRLQAEYQQSFGITTREHYLAAYEPNWKFAERSYVYGAAQYESDRFFGYSDRVSLSSGIGYTAIQSPGVTLELELGPGYRATDFTDGSTERNVAARGSVEFDWKLTSAVALRQEASAYLQSANSTVASTTALEAKLLGPLSARFSYNVQYESAPPLPRVSTDTTTRAALVVDF